MRQFVNIVILCIGCLTTANAQTFTQRIQQKDSAKEGTLTVTHSKDIDELVNGKQQADAQPEKTNDDKPVTPKTDAAKAREQLAKILEQKQDTTTIDEPVVIDNRRKVMVGGYKINGYRVQVYAGGNSRDARIKAERVGKEINALFPGEPVYVHFYSPRWICRMGNYRTYEEAHQMLMSIRKLGISGASIVKGKITVQY